MKQSSHPIGLHLHLVAVGPTLRFAIWFERAAPPDLFRTAKYLAHDIPAEHPCAVGPAAGDLPAGLTKGLAQTELLVNLPCLGSKHPVPLPGLIDAWAVEHFNARSRTAGNVYPLRVPAWLLPPSRSLALLRALVHAWTDRHGAGFVSPHASTILEFITTLLRRVDEGPVLPTLILDPARTRDGATAVDVSSLRLGWAPPVRLAELCALRASLLASPFLPATLDYPYDRRFESRAATWADDLLPQRLAVFVAEALAAEVAANGPPPSDLLAQDLTSALRQGELRGLHADHGNALDVHHPVHRPFAPPTTHLHARLRPAAGDAWTAELGLTDDKRFLPLRALVASGTARDPAVDHDDDTWLIPARVLDRDLRAVATTTPALRAPEVFGGGVTLDARSGAALLDAKSWRGSPSAMSAWLSDLGVVHRGRAFTAFTAAPDNAGDARVRVTWDLAEGSDESLHGARFVPSLDLAVGDEALDLAAAEEALRAAVGPFVRVHGAVVARAALAEAVAVFRAREKVLAKLAAAKGVGLARVVELDDAWSAERAAAVTETLFAKRWTDFVSRLRDGAGVPLLDAPAGFQGALRPYQRRGLSWLDFLVARGFGACLADDMGLGKTVQVLALLARRREAAPDAPPDLVVCPTAVVLNWVREARRFTPALRVYTHQGADRATDLAARARGCDLVVTSYALLRRDAARFEAERWSVVIIDEAQQVKNPEAQQTRAAKSLRAHAKVCLTGTPIENHLRDLWSIFDLAIPGLLGGPTRFARSFVAPLRSDPAKSLGRLSGRVGPFLLRRTKRDPAIAADLPAKQEQEAWCDLTPEQVALYRAMTEATLEGIVGKDGVARRAHILAALTRFKQICNHPENFAREHPARLLGRSGKLDRAVELVEELTEEGQRALIFTQFTEMGEILRRALAEALDIDAGFYHGGLTPKAREALVDDFNAPEGPPVLIVSLKAGGSGLNLTAASAVIHYDRWWNPAVEDQATDRAHRIGQTRAVNVYKLATRGTLEERVVDILEQKRALAAQALGGADASFITEMNDRELRAFLSLGATEGA